MFTGGAKHFHTSKDFVSVAQPLHLKMFTKKLETLQTYFAGVSNKRFEIALSQERRFQEKNI